MSFPTSEDECGIPGFGICNPLYSSSCDKNKPPSCKNEIYFMLVVDIIFLIGWNPLYNILPFKHSSSDYIFKLDITESKINLAVFLQFLFFSYGEQVKIINQIIKQRFIILHMKYSHDHLLKDWVV